MELIDVLDEKGEKTGKVKLRSEVHRDGDWHRAVHVWVLNSKNELLVQKRSAQKDNNPNKWDISVGGHVGEGESSVGAAIKEIAEELGLDVAERDLEFLFTVTQQSIHHDGAYINNEFNDVYLLRRDLDLSSLKLQPEEVSEVKWITVEELAGVVENQDPGYVRHDEEYTTLITSSQT